MTALKTTSLLVATLCSAYVTAASAADAAAAAAPLTRAEVLADLEVRQLAGMPGLARGDGDIDLHIAEYMAAHTRYQQMVQSPDFAQRVTRIARKRGERVDVAAN